MSGESIRHTCYALSCCEYMEDSLCFIARVGGLWGAQPSVLDNIMTDSMYIPILHCNLSGPPPLLGPRLLLMGGGDSMQYFLYICIVEREKSIDTKIVVICLAELVYKISYISQYCPMVLLFNLPHFVSNNFCRFFSTPSTLISIIVLYIDRTHQSVNNQNTFVQLISMRVVSMDSSHSQLPIYVEIIPWNTSPIYPHSWP